MERWRLWAGAIGFGIAGGGRDVLAAAGAAGIGAGAGACSKPARQVATGKYPVRDEGIEIKPGESCIGRWFISGAIFLCAIGGISSNNAPRFANANSKS